jgi:hypothetical protein
MNIHHRTTSPVRHQLRKNLFSSANCNVIVLDINIISVIVDRTVVAATVPSLVISDRQNCVDSIIFHLYYL